MDCGLTSTPRRLHQSASSQLICRVRVLMIGREGNRNGAKGDDKFKQKESTELLKGTPHVVVP